jgi:hypothetical protein
LEEMVLKREDPPIPDSLFVPDPSPEDGFCAPEEEEGGGEDGEEDVLACLDVTRDSTEGLRLAAFLWDHFFFFAAIVVVSLPPRSLSTSWMASRTLRSVGGDMGGCGASSEEGTAR